MPTHVVPASVRRLWGLPVQNDLPPTWDGVPVEWRGWQPIETTLDWHLPLDQVACDKCGGLGEGSLFNSGLRQTPDGPRRNLSAHRCPHCGHDSVWDTETDQHWDLDETDYGDEGSVEPAAASAQLQLF